MAAAAVAAAAASAVRRSRRRRRPPARRRTREDRSWAWYGSSLVSEVDAKRQGRVRVLRREWRKLPDAKKRALRVDVHDHVAARLLRNHVTNESAAIDGEPDNHQTGRPDSRIPDAGDAAYHRREVIGAT